MHDDVISDASRSIGLAMCNIGYAIRSSVVNSIVDAFSGSEAVGLKPTRECLNKWIDAYVSSAWQKLLALLYNTLMTSNSKTVWDPLEAKSIGGMLNESMALSYAKRTSHDAISSKTLTLYSINFFSPSFQDCLNQPIFGLLRINPLRLCIIVASQRHVFNTVI